MAYAEPMVRLLRASPTFSCYPDDVLLALGRCSRLVSLAPGEVLCCEGEPCRAVYCVDEGLMRLYRLGPEGRAQTVALVGAGETFAEEAMFSGHGYSATASALRQTRLVEVDADWLMDALRQHSELAWQMLRVLSRRADRLLVQARPRSLERAEPEVAGHRAAH